MLGFIPPLIASGFGVSLFYLWGVMKYSEKLRDPRWQKKRLEILSRDCFTCRGCGDKTRTLHVHHRNYQRGKEPWDYANSVLVTLCEDCHEYERTGRTEETDRLLEALRINGYLASEIGSLADWVVNYSFEDVNQILVDDLEKQLARSQS